MFLSRPDMDGAPANEAPGQAAEAAASAQKIADLETQLRHAQESLAAAQTGQQMAEADLKDLQRRYEEARAVRARQAQLLSDLMPYLQKMARSTGPQTGETGPPEMLPEMLPEALEEALTLGTELARENAASEPPEASRRAQKGTSSL